ncbi:matrixin family metalloprotease [bacterium]|nr:matrixin family metalloprotease [bacterium]
MKKRKLFLIGLLIWNFNSVFGQILYDDGAINLNSARYSIQGNKWNTNHLKYYFQNGTNDIDSNNERNAVREAFEIWSCLTPLTFTEANSASNADIVILWGSGNHGDDYPFDSQNGVLAHAFFPPPNGGSLAGDVHFDDSENWTLNMRSNSLQPIDLVTVAAHEIGHSLGLNHSSDSNALMYAYYTGSHRFLDIDDINGIQAIYGSKPVVGLSNINDVCYTSNKTIQYTDPCGTNLEVLTWQVSSNVTVLSSNNNSITVRASSSNSTGGGWVKAILNNGVILQEDFIIGKPSSSSLRIITTGNGIRLFSKTWQELFGLGGENIEWKIIGTSVLKRNSGPDSILIYPTTTNHGQIITIAIRSKNECGYSNWKYQDFRIYSTTSDGGIGVMH